MTDQGYTRRAVLGAGGAGALGAGLLGLAACGSTGSAGGTTAPAAGSAGPLVKLADVPVGGSVAAKLDGKPVVVSQKAAGTVAAFSAICTHMGCTVNAGGAQFHCPCHGSVYDAFTGEVVHGPAPRALTSIPVKVDAGEVVTS